MPFVELEDPWIEIFLSMKDSYEKSFESSPDYWGYSSLEILTDSAFESHKALLQVYNSVSLSPLKTVPHSVLDVLYDLPSNSIPMLMPPESTPMSEDRVQLRERIAKRIYELNPCIEGGEYVDGFQVSPDGELSWDHAKSRDAEFSPEYSAPITKDAYAAADIALEEFLAAGWQEIPRIIPL